MKTPQTWRNVVSAVAVLLAVCNPLLGTAGPMGDTGPLSGQHCVQVTTRPLSDFLEAQGSTVLFFSPVQDMLGWTNAAFLNFGLVDYAGLANAYIEAETGTSLGTDVNGTIRECTRADGTAMIAVMLSTQNALGFAQSIPDLLNHGLDFLATPTIFGAKAQDVIAGATPAVGSATFRTTFVMSAPGAPLPDIRIAFQSNMPDVRPITMDFRSLIVGTLPDGTSARMRIHQVGATEADGQLVFTKEVVDILSGNTGE